MPRTGLEPARRETHAPETCASTNSATWASEGKNLLNGVFRMLSGKRDSDPRPQPWQGCALPTELFPHFKLLTRSTLLQMRCKGNAFFLKPQTFWTFFSFIQISQYYDNVISPKLPTKLGDFTFQIGRDWFSNSPNLHSCFYHFPKHFYIFCHKIRYIINVCQSIRFL